MELNVFFYVFLLFVGLASLWWSGDKATLYSRQASHLFGLTSFFVGFVIVAIATGIPELAIAITSVLNKVPSLSVGDIIGSNFTDISLVLGIPTLVFGAIYVRKREYKDLIFTLIMTVLVMGIVFVFGFLQKIHGLILIGLYVLCLVELWRSRHIETATEEEAEASREAVAEEEVLASKSGTLLKLAGSIVLVLLASQLSVYSAIKIANAYGLGLAMLGSTAIALGTSFPELILSFSAVRRKDYSLAIGNALGSVLEQGTLILGILAFLSPEPINLRAAVNVAPFMFIAFGILGYGLVKREKISRIEGGILIFVYLLFLVYNYFVQVYKF